LSHLHFDESRIYSNWGSRRFERHAQHDMTAITPGTPTIAFYAAYEDDPQSPGAPRPAYGHSKDGRNDLKQVLLSLGVSSDGGLPVRLGLRDGNQSDSVETPLAIEECLTLGLEGVRGIVADSKVYSRRTLGVCLEHKIGLVT
jgi:hypothetical protein